MRLSVAGAETYAYTAKRELDRRRPALIFVHGAANDHSVWALQSRYFAHHGYGVLAVDLPGHSRRQRPGASVGFGVSQQRPIPGVPGGGASLEQRPRLADCYAD